MRSAYAYTALEMDDKEPVPFVEATTPPPAHQGSADEAVGVARIEATQAVWGNRGWYLVVAGLGLSMIVYELDNTTTYNYRPYALSAYSNVSLSTTLLTAGGILFAVCKPLFAKSADVFGRAETYTVAVLFYLLAYVLCAASQDVAAFAVGSLFHSVAQTGMNLLNDVIVSDITTPRWRAFGLACAFTPFLIVPWCAGFIVDSVVRGIGWRWGYGILAIVLPFAVSFIIVTLAYYQTKAKRMGLAPATRPSLAKCLSQIDAVGLFLLMAGFACLLLPINLAATTASKWKTPWIPALLAVGLAIIIACVLYEAFLARYPVLPVRYFKDATIVCCFAIGMCDQISFEGTHAYLYTWVTVSLGYGPLEASYLTFVNGMTQTLVAILVGLWLAQTRFHPRLICTRAAPFLHASPGGKPSPKAILLLGALLRLVGYGVMIRLRAASSSKPELFLVQLIQGLGSGCLGILTITAAQLRVPRREMAQVTALVLLFQFVGAALGDTYAGAIYTNFFRPRLRARLGPSAPSSLVDTVFASISSAAIPARGTPERQAINEAYSDVMRLIAYVALAVSLLLCLVCGVALFCWGGGEARGETEGEALS